MTTPCGAAWGHDSGIPGYKTYALNSKDGRDCISFLDDALVDAVQGLGSVRAIAHPHLQGCHTEWSRVLGGVPVYLHAADPEWVMRADACVEYWEGDRLDL